jgi:hypothetical protein
VREEQIEFDFRINVFDSNVFQIEFPLWLNADILEGPHATDQQPRKPSKSRKPQKTH